MWFTDLWNSYLEYWQRCCQDMTEALPKPANAMTQMTPFAPFFTLPGQSEETDLATLWQDWATIWQWPRIEAQIRPLEAPNSGELDDLMQLSMRIFMPWNPDILQVEALVRRGEKGKKVLTSHEVDVIPEIAETQKVLSAPKHAKK